MATRLIPGTASTRTVPAPDAGGGGGGGGGGNAWKDWVDLPLDPTDANGWIVRDGVGVNANTSLGMDGSVLKFEQSVGSRLQIQGSTMKGKVMIRKQHITPWADAGIAQPDGVAAHIFQPESLILKLECLFDTDGGGPINGVSSGGYGQNMTCMVGLVGYSSDQSGAPTIGGTSVLWLAAQCKKATGNEPGTYTNTNLYASGYKSYFTTSGTTTGYTWKNQQSAPAQSHDSIVFCTPPIRKEASTGRNDVWGGSYSSTHPFFPVAMAGQSLYDNSTKFSNPSGQTYWHICVWFGADNNTPVNGVIRIKRLRYLWQPVQNRASLT
jgi:hypothetical protein